MRLHGCNGTTHKPQFQSTHSLRSATSNEKYQNGNPMVSIHALLAECDPLSIPTVRQTRCFNPRTPCGVRHKILKSDKLKQLFQSTHSLRSATDPDDMATFLREVSIHALLAECDKWAFGLISAVCCFNPRTPCGVRHVINRPLAGTVRFQSTHSLRSATLLLSFRLPKLPVSIHALLAECDCAGRI